MCKPGCDCKTNIRVLRYNLEKSELKYETFQGRSHLIVPVILAKSDVVMNGALLPEDEYLPLTWNGVPVTVGHPSDDDGMSISANSPMVLEAYAIGNIFNAHVKDKALRGEAWIDIERANASHPKLIKMIEDGAMLDVSTGYFSDDEKKSGKSNGVEFNSISRNIRPDHLALLPGDTGACSWADGCGVRANRSEETMADEKKTEENKTVTVDVSGMVPRSEVDAMVTNAVAKALADAKPVISEDDRKAIAHANKILAERKAELVTNAVANSRLSKEQAEAMDIATLELFINALPEPVADYSGRQLATNTAGDDSIAKDMSPPSIVELFKKKA